RATLTQPSGDRGAGLQHPSPHRLVGGVQTTLRQQLLELAVAQGDPEIKPDRVLNDLGREAMAAVAERSHADILPDAPMAPTRFPRQCRQNGLIANEDMDQFVVTVGPTARQGPQPTFES